MGYIWPSVHFRQYFFFGTHTPSSISILSIFSTTISELTRYDKDGRTARLKYLLSHYLQKKLTDPCYRVQNNRKVGRKGQCKHLMKGQLITSLVSSKVAGSKRQDPLEAEPVISLTPLHPDYPWHPDRCLCRDSAPHCQAPLAVPSNIHTHTHTHTQFQVCCGLHTEVWKINHELPQRRA